MCPLSPPKWNLFCLDRSCSTQCAASCNWGCGGDPGATNKIWLIRAVSIIYNILYIFILKFTHDLYKVQIQLNSLYCIWQTQALRKIAIQQGKLLAPRKKSYDQSTQHIKKQRHYFANKSPSSQRYGFSSSMYGCEIWTIKKAEC